MRSQAGTGKKRATLNQAGLVEGVGNGTGQSDKVVLLRGDLGGQSHHQLRHRHAALRRKNRVDRQRYDPVGLVPHNEINIGQQHIIVMGRPHADFPPDPIGKSRIGQKEIRRRSTKIDAYAVKIRDQDLG